MSNTELIKSGPGPRTAFIEKADAKVIAETMVAFANTEGGTLIVGMEEDSETATQKIETDALDKALKEADALCNPTVVVGNWETVELEEAGGTVYTLRVPRSIELHALTEAVALYERKGNVVAAAATRGRLAAAARL